MKFSENNTVSYDEREKNYAFICQSLQYYQHRCRLRCCCCFFASATQFYLVLKALFTTNSTSAHSVFFVPLLIIQLYTFVFTNEKKWTWEYDRKTTNSIVKKKQSQARKSTKRGLFSNKLKEINWLSQRRKKTFKKKKRFSKVEMYFWNEKIVCVCSLLEPAVFLFGSKFVKPKCLPLCLHRPGVCVLSCFVSV